MGGWGSTTDKEIDAKLWKCPMFSSRHSQVGYLVLLGRNWPEGEFKNVSQSPVAQVSMWICQKYSCIKYFPQNILQNMCSQTDITFFLTAASLYTRILVFTRPIDTATLKSLLYLLLFSFTCIAQPSPAAWEGMLVVWSGWGCLLQATNLFLVPNECKNHH